MDFRIVLFKSCFVLIIYCLFCGSCKVREQQGCENILLNKDFHLDDIIWSYKLNYTNNEKYRYGHYNNAELLPFEAFYITLRLYSQKNYIHLVVWGAPSVPILLCEESPVFYTAQGYDTCFVYCNPDVEISCIDELTKYNYRIFDNDYEPTFEEKYVNYLHSTFDNMFEQIYIFGDDHKWHYENAGYGIAKFRYLGQ